MVEPDQLSTFVIAMQKQMVIMPAEVVAEIIPYEPLQRVDDTPDWFIGLLGWRGVQVPVVSFEMLTIERASFSLVSVASASLVIVRGMTDQQSLPFYALVSQTRPSSHLITDEMLFETGEALEQTEAAKVRFQNDIVSIPNLEFVESALLEAVV